MRYRALTDMDYQLGRSQAEFLINSPAAVAQLVKTRLLLPTGEWFLDLTEGTPYREAILGFHTQGVYDQAIQERILGTQGVVSILEYQSVLDDATRALTVAARLDTLYGSTDVFTIPIGF